MQNKLLSVIVPVYNKEEYIVECLESILKQKYKELEIILVNDGSSDKSGDICDEYALLDNRIKVIHQENKGMIGARYTGLCHASADYVIFLDADDFIAEDMYSDLMEIVNKYDVDMVTSGCFRYRGEDDLVKDICSRVDVGLYSREEIREKILPVMFWEDKWYGWLIDPSLCMKILRKTILLEQYNKTKDFGFSYGEDSAIIYPAILQMRQIYITHNCYYYHRQRPKDAPATYLISRDFLPNLWTLYKYLEEQFSVDSDADCLLYQLDMFFVKSVQYLQKRKPEVKVQVINKKTWMFPFDQVSKGSRVVLYGAGNIGTQYWKQLSMIPYVESVLWVDKNAAQINNENVHSIAEISKDEYDWIVMAIKSEETCNHMKEIFIKDGWKPEQIIIPNFERLLLNA